MPSGPSELELAYHPRAVWQPLVDAIQEKSCRPLRVDNRRR